MSKPPCVHHKVPRCPRCGGKKHRARQSKLVGEVRIKRTSCKTCGCKFNIIEH